MSSLNILSGGAAHGLVASLAPELKARTGLDISGEFGAVGVMAEKLRNGVAADIVILTAALLARLADEKLVVAASIADVGLVETALAVRSADPRVSVKDADDLRAAFLAADAIFVPDTKASTAGIHVAKVLNQLGIADEGRSAAEDLSERRDRDAASGGLRRGAADRLHAIDRNHRHQRRCPVGRAAAGMWARDHVHGWCHHARRQCGRSAGADRFADWRRSAPAAHRAGFLSGETWPHSARLRPPRSRSAAQRAGTDSRLCAVRPARVRSAAVDRGPAAVAEQGARAERGQPPQGALAPGSKTRALAPCVLIHILIYQL